MRETIISCWTGQQLQILILSGGRGLVASTYMVIFEIMKVNEISQEVNMKRKEKRAESWEILILNG